MWVAGPSQTLQNHHQLTTMETYYVMCDEEDVGVIKLAQALWADTVPESILQRLDVLLEKLADPSRRERVAQMFLRAEGLPTIIHHLAGTSRNPHPAYPEAVQAAMAEKAGRVLRPLHEARDVLWPVMHCATGIVTPLIKALRAGSLENRCLAGETLARLIQAQPCAGRAMAAEGVMGLLCSLYNDIQDLPDLDDLARPLAHLAFQVGTSEPLAAADLANAIRGPDILESFSAMTILQVGHPRAFPCPPLPDTTTIVRKKGSPSFCLALSN
jgi:hypothetical protein